MREKIDFDGPPDRVASQIADGIEELIARTLPRELPAELTGVGWRVKSASSIADKRRRTSRHFIDDYIGIRLVLPTQRTVVDASAAVLSWASSAGLLSIDPVEHPSLNSLHQSIHLQFRFDGHLQISREGFGLEVQILSWMSNYVSAWSRLALYKRTETPTGAVTAAIENLQARCVVVDLLADDLVETLRREHFDG